MPTRYIFRQTRRKSYTALILAAALLTLPSAGWAQGAAENPDDPDKAEAYYQQGVNAFFNKNYSLAVTYFKRANALDPDPVVLYNISLAQSRLANADEALDAAEEAARMGGLPEDTALKNQARIRAYQRIIAAESTAQALAPEDAPAAQGTAPAPGVAEAPPAVGTVGWVGIGTASAGALTLAGAGLLALMVRNDLDEYDTARADGDYERARALQQDVRDGQSIGQILLYSGAGLLAVGATLWAVDFFADQESAPASSLSMRAGAAPGEAGVQLHFNF